MMNHLSLAAAVLSAATLLGSCALQPGVPFAPGLQRSSVAVQVNTSEIDDGSSTQETDTLSIEVGHAWFMTEALELGGRLEYSDTSVEGGTELTTAVVAASARYYAPSTESTRFFGEAMLGVGNAELEVFGMTFDESVFAWSLGGGILAFVTENTALEAKLRYQMIDVDEID